MKRFNGLRYLLPLLLATVVMGQDKTVPVKPVTPPPAASAAPAKDVPKLAPDVKEELLKAQIDLYKAALGQKELKENYDKQAAQAQEHFNVLNNVYNSLVGQGLKKSGIDDTKYKLDPSTLDVSEISNPANPADKVVTPAVTPTVTPATKVPAKDKKGKP